MNLDATIEMPKAEARAAYEDYAAAAKRRHNVEDEAIAAGYKALAEGKKLIALSEVIKAGGEHDDGLPKLAVSKALADWCYVDRVANGGVTFRPSERARVGRIRFPDGTLPRRPWSDHSWSRGWGMRAMVPIVPPRVRPTRALTTYHVLWEATWERAPRPPGDPALLKHLRGDLWIVLATWDLTPLEQAVLAERTLQS